MAPEAVMCPNCQVEAVAGEDGVLRCPKCNGAFGQSPAGEAKLVGADALATLTAENSDLKERLSAAQQRERDLRTAVAGANDNGHQASAGFELDDPYPPVAGDEDEDEEDEDGDGVW